MSARQLTGPQDVAVALAEAMNAHDIDAFVALFAPDYDSRQPAHPDRAFVGRDQVRTNWSAVFAGVPDFRADVVATAVEAETLWSEWRWHGTQRHGSPLEMAGVIVCGVQAGALGERNSESTPSRPRPAARVPSSGRKSAPPDYAAPATPAEVGCSP